MKTIKVDQPAGIGDILWIQKITHKISKEYKVFHPVKDEIEWMIDYMPNLCKYSQVPSECDEVLKLDGIPLPSPDSKVMEAKYQAVNVSWDDYLDFIHIDRNYTKEEELFSKIYPGKPYRLICPNYGTPKNRTSTGTHSINIPHSDTLENIEITNIEGYTLFDWIKIIQEADEIYTTDTCILFLIELYKCKASEFICYPRNNCSRNVEYFLKKNWRFIKW